MKTTPIGMSKRQRQLSRLGTGLVAIVGTVQVSLAPLMAGQPWQSQPPTNKQAVPTQCSTSTSTYGTVVPTRILYCTAFGMVVKSGYSTHFIYLPDPAPFLLLFFSLFFSFPSSTNVDNHSFRQSLPK